MKGGKDEDLLPLSIAVVLTAVEAAYYQAEYEARWRDAMRLTSLLTKGSRVAAQSIRAGARQMSSATEAEAKEQMIRWTQISKGMIGLTGTFTVYNVFAHFAGGHEHHDEAPAFAYLKLRNKPFPWEYSGCDLLDSHCKELARAAKQALKDEE